MSSAAIHREAEASQSPTPVHSSSPRSSPKSAGSHDDLTISGGSRQNEQQGCSKKRKSQQTWKEESPVLKDDGHAWRKYGQKEINGQDYPRSYFRCSYWFDAIKCQARKHVEQIRDDPPLYRTTYHGRHTCRSVINTMNSPRELSSISALMSGADNDQSVDTFGFIRFDGKQTVNEPFSVSPSPPVKQDEYGHSSTLHQMDMLLLDQDGRHYSERDKSSFSAYDDHHHDIVFMFQTSTTSPSAFRG